MAIWVEPSEDTMGGTYVVQRSKNAVLPQLCAALLSSDPTVLEEVPDLQDVRIMLDLFSDLGVEVQQEGREIRIEGKPKRHLAHYRYVNMMRASFLVLAPLLGRLGKAAVALPGGCAIGVRGVDFHLEGLRAMGAELQVEAGYVRGKLHGKFQGTSVALPYPSVGATEQLLMAAVCAEGNTTILNAAHEPEVDDFVRFLIACGAEIEGLGTNKLEIVGGKELHGARYKTIGDRIEAGSIVALALSTRTPLKLTGVGWEHVETLAGHLFPLGVLLSSDQDGSVSVNFAPDLHGGNFQTGPYPAFPTDVQAQFVAALATIPEDSIMRETVFENRFLYVPELRRIGMNVDVDGSVAVVRGGQDTRGAEVQGTDIRSVFALIIAGASAHSGRTLIHRETYVHRGYENIVSRLRSIGVKIGTDF